jgi:hypothetical protein
MAEPRTMAEGCVRWMDEYRDVGPAESGVRMPALTLLDSARGFAQMRPEDSACLWRLRGRSRVTSVARYIARCDVRIVERARLATQLFAGANVRIGRDVLSLEIIQPLGTRGGQL